MSGYQPVKTENNAFTNAHYPFKSWDEYAGYTNNVLMQNEEKKHIYYLPCYFRFKIKNVMNIQIKDLCGEVNSAVIISIYYGDLPKEISEKLAEEVSIQTNKDEPIDLKEGEKGVKIKHDAKQKMYNYTIRATFHADISSDVFWSPFEIINLVITFCIQPASFKLNGQSYELKFNCMVPDKGMISFVNNIRFGCYDLAEQLLKAEYQNVREPLFLQQARPLETDEIIDKVLGKFTEHQDQGKVQYFQYVHLRIPFYKYPSSALATIFIPLWLLGIINLGIFFQDPDLAGRIASIATLMLAFIAFIPTIRDQIPPSPDILLVQMMVFLQTSTGLLCLFDSLTIMSLENYQFVWYQDLYYIWSLLITVFSITFIFCLFLMHKYKWEPQYNAVEPAKEQKMTRNISFNLKCDKYFKLRKDIVTLPAKQNKDKGQKGGKGDQEEKGRTLNTKASNEQDILQLSKQQPNKSSQIRQSTPFMQYLSKTSFTPSQKFDKEP